MDRTIKEMQFHSSISNVQQIITLELGLDKIENNNTLININIKDPFSFISVFRFLVLINMESKTKTYYNKSDYEKWRESKILSVIDQQLNTAATKLEHLSEDLKQIQDRRDDMATKMKHQIAHYQKMKHRIPSMMKLRETYNQDYFPVLLRVYTNLIEFETVSLYNHYLATIKLKENGFESLEGQKVGMSSFEVNYPFFKTLHSLGIIGVEEVNNVIINSNKVRTKNLQALNLTSGKRFFYFQKNKIIDYQLLKLFDYLISAHRQELHQILITINKENCFALFHHINHLGGKNSEIELLIPTYTTEIGVIKTDQDNHQIKLQNDEIDFTVQNKLNIQSIIFWEIRDTLIDLEKITVEVLSTNHPFKLSFHYSNDKILEILSFNGKNISQQTEFIKILIASLVNQTNWRQEEMVSQYILEADTFDIIEIINHFSGKLSKNTVETLLLYEIMKGKLSWNNETSTYSKSDYLYFGKIKHIELSKRHIVSSVFGKLFREKINKAELETQMNLQATVGNYSTEITLDKFNEIEKTDCTCNVERCVHAYGLLNNKYLK